MYVKYEHVKEDFAKFEKTIEEKEKEIAALKDRENAKALDGQRDAYKKLFEAKKKIVDLQNQLDEKDKAISYLMVGRATHKVH